MKRLIPLRIYTLASFLFVQSSTAFGQTIGQLKQQLQTARHDTTRVRLLYDLNRRYILAQQPDSMYWCAQQLLALATAHHDDFFLAKYYLVLRSYYHQKKLFDKSEQALKKVLQIFQSLKAVEHVANARLSLIALCTDKGDLKQAIALAMENIDYCTQYKLVEIRANTYVHLVNTYSKLQNDPQMLRYLNLYLADAKQSNDPDQLIMAYDWKAAYYEGHGAYAKAWPFRKRSVELARRFTMPSYTIETLRKAAINLRKRHQLQAAIAYLQEAFAVGKTMPDKAAVDIVWQELSQNELALKHYPAALQAAQAGLATARLDGRPQNRLDALQNLTAIQEATGHFQSALHSYKTYKTLQDSLFSVEKNVKIAQIQTQYDVAQKENIILLLNKNNQIQQEQFRIVSQQRLLFGLGLAFLLLISVGTGYFLRQISQRNKEISSRSEQLQQAVQLRDKLFSILTHDLRSPMANLLFSISLLQRNPAKTNGLADLEQQVNQVYATLDNLLYWSLSQQNGLRPNFVRFNLTELVNEVLADFGSMIASKQLQLTVQPDSQDNTVLADENMAQICLRNILHNAIKFSAEHGSINLTFAQGVETVSLIIQDEGGSMPQPKAVLSSGETSRSEQGTGLGLVVTQELMQASRGQLAIQSQLGQGTAVTLTFRAGA